MYYLFHHPYSGFGIFTTTVMSGGGYKSIHEALSGFKPQAGFNPQGKYEIQGSKLVRNSSWFYLDPTDKPPFEYHADVIAEFESFDQLKVTHPEFFL